MSYEVPQNRAPSDGGLTLRRRRSLCKCRPLRVPRRRRTAKENSAESERGVMGVLSNVPGLRTAPHPTTPCHATPRHATPRHTSRIQDSPRAAGCKRNAIHSKDAVAHVLELLGDLARCPVELVGDRPLFGRIERRELLAQVAIHYILHATRVPTPSRAATLIQPREEVRTSCHAQTTDATKRRHNSVWNCKQWSRA